MEVFEGEKFTRSAVVAVLLSPSRVPFESILGRRVYGVVVSACFCADASGVLSAGYPASRLVASVPVAWQWNTLGVMLPDGLWCGVPVCIHEVT